MNQTKQYFSESVQNLNQLHKQLNQLIQCSYNQGQDDMMREVLDEASKMSNGDLRNIDFCDFQSYLQNRLKQLTLQNHQGPHEIDSLTETNSEKEIDVVLCIFHNFSLVVQKEGKNSRARHQLINH